MDDGRADGLSLGQIIPLRDSIYVWAGVGTVPAAMAAGEKGPGWYSDKTLNNPAILKLAKKVTTRIDEECTKAYFRKGKGYLITKIEIRTKSGKRFSALENPTGF